MGTRHIIEIIKDGNVAVRQYGQWDGYAETAAYHLRNFIREHGADTGRSLIDKTQIQKKDGVPISPDGFHMAESEMRTTEPIFYIWQLRRLGFFSDYIPNFWVACIPAAIEKFGLEETMSSFSITWETGYKILDVIAIFTSFKEFDEKKLKFPVYLEDENCEPGRKIIINLDDETFTCEYFDIKYTWGFKQLPTLAELRTLDKACRQK